MTKTLFSIALFMFSTTAFAAPAAAPIKKNGSCPSGYNSSGNYCVPSSNAKFAIEKNGSCPSGYNSSGNYCVASRSNSPNVMHKSGSCPSGWNTSGKYCYKN